MKGRDLGQLLRRVAGFLQRLEGGRSLDHAGDGGLVHFSSSGFQPGALLGVLALALGRIGGEQHRGAVRVVEQRGTDQVLEHALAARKAGLHAAERRLEIQRIERIAAVQPGPHGAEDQRDAARERAGVVLTQLEFERIDGRRNGLFIDAVAGKPGKRIEHQRFDLAGVLRPDAL